MLKNAWQYIRQRVSRTQATRFAISLAIALVLWGWVTQLQDPVQTQRYAEVSITTPDLPGTMQIVTTLPRATLFVTDVESRLEDFARSDILLTLDTSRVSGPGSYQLPVIAETSRTVREIDVSPDTVSVQVEEEISQNFPLTVENRVLASDARRITDINPEVSEVTVSGTESAVNRIARVVLPVSLERQSRSFVAMIEPEAVDDEGQQVQEVTILPGHVRTEVELETSGKTVSIVPQITGSPADGYVVQQTIAVPATIIVDGPEEVLDSLLFLNTEPVDISGATESLSRTVKIQDLPPEVTLIEPTNNEVEVRVSIGTSGGTANVIPDMPIEIANAPEGFRVTTDPETIDIGVSAPSDTLASLTPSDVRVTIDVAELTPGVHTVTPDVELPDNINVTRLEPERVVVLITDPSATPTAAGTPIPDQPT
ncbi:MAG TPA: CdaR family protein [Thermomicrobiales bacterium]|nr:CdaR family protein [Thermomicrobiales bacterium]